jgi:hypothetical protein
VRHVQAGLGFDRLQKIPTGATYESPYMQERALESLFVNYALLYGMQFAIGTGEAFNREYFLIAYRVRQDRTRICANIFDQDGTSPHSARSHPNFVPVSPSL